MSYKSFAEVVKEKREAVKKAFPDFKFSIRKDNNSIYLSVLEAPIMLTNKDYEPVNHFYIQDHFKGEAKEALLKIYQILNGRNYTVVEDGDYGAVPSFYVNMKIGDWDKPFKFISGAAAFSVKKFKKAI